MNVVFSHGKESGPWGTKIKELAKIAEEKGFEVDSVDYQGIDNVDDRALKLREKLTFIEGPVVLVGSSMGGYVATACAAQVGVFGELFEPNRGAIFGSDILGGISVGYYPMWRILVGCIAVKKGVVIGAIFNDTGKTQVFTAFHYHCNAF